MMQSLEFSVGMFSVLLLGGVVLACLVVLVRGLRLPKRFPCHASCGSCGYEIAFTSPRCTECGHDLRITGTLTAHTALRLRSNPIIMLIAWTILIGLAFAGAMAVYMSLPSMAVTYVTSGNTRARFSPMRRFLTRADEAADRLPDYNLTLNGSYTGSEWDSLTLRFVPDEGPRLLMTFDASNRSWTLEGNGEPVQGNGVDVAAVQQLYEAAQIDIENEVIQIEIGQLASILDQALSTPSTFGSNNLQIQDPRLTDEPARADPEPNLRVLEDMGGSYSSDGTIATETNEYRIGSFPESVIAVTIEYDWNENGRPAHLKSLYILMPAEIGWPIEIRSDLETDTWRAIRNEETLHEGARPATEEDAKVVLREMKEDLEAPLSDALALDVADLINLTDDDLIGFTGWRTPRQFDRSANLVGGLQHNGGGSGSSMQSVQPPYGVLFYLLCAGFLATWIGGGWFMVARRRRLITPPTTA